MNRVSDDLTELVRMRNDAQEQAAVYAHRSVCKPHPPTNLLALCAASASYYIVNRRKHWTPNRRTLTSLAVMPMVVMGVNWLGHKHTAYLWRQRQATIEHEIRHWRDTGDDQRAARVSYRFRFHQCPWLFGTHLPQWVEVDPAVQNLRRSQAALDYARLVNSWCSTRHVKLAPYAFHMGVSAILYKDEYVYEALRQQGALDDSDVPPKSS